MKDLKNLSFNLLLLLLITIINSCKPVVEINDRSDLEQNDNDSIKGIVFCIDDYYVETFYEHYDYIQNTGIKMTYFITQYHRLSSLRKQIIHKFYIDGHEIGFHGTNHINAVNYLQEHTIDEYINYEILPDLEMMKEDGYNVTNFSYPFGAHTTELDSILFSRYFYFIKLGRTHFFFYTKNMDKQIIHPFPLDDRYWERYHLSFDDALKFIDSANKQDKIIMFYSHMLGNEYNPDINSTWIVKFRAIMDYAKEKGFKFYTLQDLQKMDKDAAKIILYPDEIFPDKNWNDIEFQKNNFYE